jgi:hypothetical protein
MAGRIPAMGFNAPWKEPKPQLSSTQRLIEAGSVGEAKTKIL